mmetsp:Transcript_1581/g.3140  ORF Transcript_1581/g.3140 Transcript_1581/m.3140 type:complete len:115 (-) Transcript_1581:324-668(-)
MNGMTSSGRQGAMAKQRFADADRQSGAKLPLRIEDISGDESVAQELREIEELVDGRSRAVCFLMHSEACKRERDQYIDPSTQNTVFTAYFLKKRECCGHRCRHCPWNHRNVPGR